MIRRAASAVVLIALSIYIVAGAVIVPFHGDEPMQIHMSNDYVALTIDRDPDYLKVSPPYPIDGDGVLRLINGSVNRYLIGASWHIAGYDSGDLPPRPGWDWGLSYDDNLTTGHRPAGDFMTIARLSSALLTAVGVWLIYASGHAVGGVTGGMIAAAIYALHPVILLNGRRAMQEGSMLAFGMLAIAAACAWTLLDDRAPAWRRVSVAALLALAAALALASKHSAIVFVAGAYAVIGVDMLLRRAGWRRRIEAIALATVSGGLAIGLWIMLSPALWNDPSARLGDLLTERAALIDIQVTVNVPGLPMTTAQRIESIALQPFLRPAQFYEVGYWGESAAVRAEIAAYRDSFLYGLPLGEGIGVIIGGLLTGLALIGIGVGLIDGWRRRRSGRGRLMLGASLWTVTVAASLMVNPLDWQRYYLVLIPPLILCVGMGVAAVWTLRSRLVLSAPAPL
ncbi:MAG: hypothetical protein SGJ24_18615 [Chloroflexota bacterium]|nr:hypothetical protein [Chloroflexota bacterium]